MKEFWKNIKVIVALPIILIIAWVITHIMALLGVFATAAYPIWAVFFHKQSLCLGCRSTSTGDKCALCGEIVDGHDLSPKNPKSVILNTFVILLLTFISLGVVYLENTVIDNSGILRSFKTVSFNIPDKSQYRTNEIFPMKIQISGIKTAINVVQADITFDPEVLEVIEISTKDSFASIFVQKDINNNLGYVRLTGGIPSPGYNKEEGVFGTVFFKAKSAGLVTVSFLPTSLVLADDGRGTNVLKDFPTTSYVIRPESITPEEEINQKNIYDKSVLGASIVDDLSMCRIDLEGGKLPDVLGASDGFPTPQEADDAESLPQKIWLHFLVFLDHFNEYVLSLYSKVLSNIFTK